MLLEITPVGPLGANCCILAPAPGGACVVIDAGQQARGVIDDVVARHRLTPVAVLATHGHFDHVASAAAVCAAYDVPLYLGAGDGYMLDRPLDAISDELRGALPGLLGPDEDLDALRPERVVEIGGDDLPLGLAGLDLTAMPVPGHTPGSVTYRLAGPITLTSGADAQTMVIPEILFTGDTLFAGSIGRTDLPGGSTETILASIAERLLVRPDEALVIPGHGPATSVGAERATNPFLR